MQLGTTIVYKIYLQRRSSSIVGLGHVRHVNIPATLSHECALIRHEVIASTEVLATADNVVDILMFTGMCLVVTRRCSSRLKCLPHSSQTWDLSRERRQEGHWQEIVSMSDGEEKF